MNESINLNFASIQTFQNVIYELVNTYKILSIFGH